MGRTLLSLFVAAITCATTAGLGCELVGGIDKRTLGAAAASPSDGGAGDGDTPSGDFATCTVTGTGGALLRFGNVFPSTDRIDLCLRPSTAASFAGIKPVFASAGGACAQGLGYKNVTKGLPFPADTYEVKVVRAGVATCDGEAVTTLTQALAADAQPTALYMIGNGRTKPSLRRFVESRPGLVSSANERVLVATDEFPAVDFGPLKKRSLPADFAKKFIANVAYGDPSPKGDSTVKADENGYIADASNSGTLLYGISAPGGTTATYGVVRKINPGTSYTFFVLGTMTIPDFPLEVWACDEIASNGILASCSDAPPVTLRVDTIDLNLTGAFSAPAVNERRAAAIDAIAKLPADVVCAQSVYSDADKQAFIDAAKGQFPYSYFAATTSETLPDDPRDITGYAPPDPQVLLCEGASATSLNAAVDCLRDHCSTDPGKESGVAPNSIPSTCISDHCYDQFAEIITAYPNCWTCLFGQYASYEPMSQIRNVCTTRKGNVSFFRGQSPPLILSRFPIKEPDRRVLPGDGFRNTVLRAPIALENGANVDVYCGGPGTVFDACETYFPGPSRYGNGATNCLDAFRNLQFLQATQIRDWILSTSGAPRNRFVFGAMMSSGPAFGDAIAAQNPQNFAVVSAALSLGIPAGYTPECTECPDNALRAQAGAGAAIKGVWSTFNMIGQIPVTDVRKLSIILKDATVPDATNPAVRYPVSTSYGVSSEIRIAP